MANSNQNVKVGVLPDGSKGFRLEQNNVGIAQFSQFKDGTTGLKVVNTAYNVDVSNAQDNELVFNSTNIVGTQTFGPLTLGPSSNQAIQVTIPHKLGYIPNYAVQGPVFGLNLGGYTDTFPSPVYAPIPPYFSAGAYPFIYTYYSGVDATNLYLSVLFENTDASDTNTSQEVTLTYYILRYL